MPNKEKTYVEVYEEFMADYNVGQTSAEVVGATIAMLAQYFCSQNMLLGKTDQRFNKVMAELGDKVDEGTGKMISVAKADVMAKATPEYAANYAAKINLQNVEQCINALKALQKGISNEYSHVSSI